MSNEKLHECKVLRVLQISTYISEQCRPQPHRNKWHSDIILYLSEAYKRLNLKVTCLSGGYLIMFFLA